MAGRFTVETVFKAIDKMSAPVTRMQNRVGKFTRSASAGFRRMDKTFTKMTRGIKRGAVVAAAALGAIAVAAKDVIGVGAEFGRAIGSAAAKFPDKIKRGTDEFRALEKAARDVGAVTEFTATQAAQGLNFLAKAGFDAKFSMKALKPIVDFATSSEIDFAEAADIASDTLGAFGLNSTDAGQRMTNLNRVMDVMSRAAGSANFTVAEMFESVKDGGAISTAAGVKIETFAAAMSFLAGAGVKASKAGTAAKNITLALAGVGNQAADVFEDLGISLADIGTGKLRDQFDVLDDLRDKLDGFGEIRRVQIIKSIFGNIPIASAILLLSKAGKGVRGVRTELEAASGSSKRTAAFIRDDVKGSLDSLDSAIAGVKISIFSLNEGPLRDTIDGMTEWVRANEKLIAANVGEFVAKVADNMGSIVKWAKRIGKGLAVFFAFTVVLKTIIGLLTLINLLAAANPITLIALGIVAVIAAVTSLVFWIDEVVAGFESMPNFLRLIFAPIGVILRATRFLKNNFDDIILAAKEFASAAGEALMPLRDTASEVAYIIGLLFRIQAAVAGIAFDALSNSVAWVVDGVSGLLDKVGGLGNVLAGVPVLGPLLTSLTLIKDNFDTILDAAGRLFDFITGGPSLGGALLDGVKGAVEFAAKFVGVEVEGTSPTIEQPAVLVKPVAEVVQPVVTVKPVTDVVQPPLSLVKPVVPVAPPSIPTPVTSNVVPIRQAANDDTGQEQAADAPRPVPQLVSPQERIARSIEERRETSNAEITIKAEGVRAELTGGKLGKNIELADSGGF